MSLYAVYWDEFDRSHVRKKVSGGWQDLGAPPLRTTLRRMIWDLIEVDGAPWVCTQGFSSGGAGIGESAMGVWRYLDGAWEEVFPGGDLTGDFNPTAFGWVDNNIVAFCFAAEVWSLDLRNVPVSQLAPPTIMRSYFGLGSSIVEEVGAHGRNSRITVDDVRRTCAFNNPFIAGEIVLGDAGEDHWCWIDSSGAYHDRHDWNGSCVFSMIYDGQFLWSGDFGSFFYYSTDGHVWRRVNVTADGGDTSPGDTLGEVWEFFQWGNGYYAACCAFDPLSFGLSSAEHLVLRDRAPILRRTAVDPDTVTDPVTAAAAAWEVYRTVRLVSSEWIAQDFDNADVEGRRAADYLARAGVGLTCVQPRPDEGWVYIGYGGEPYYESEDPPGYRLPDGSPAYLAPTILRMNVAGDLSFEAEDQLDWGSGPYILADETRPTPRYGGSVPPLRFGQRDDQRQAGPNGPTSVQGSARQYGPGSYA